MGGAIDEPGRCQQIGGVKHRRNVEVNIIGPGADTETKSQDAGNDVPVAQPNAFAAPGGAAGILQCSQVIQFDVDRGELLASTGAEYGWQLVGTGDVVAADCDCSNVKGQDQSVHELIANFLSDWNQRFVLCRMIRTMITYWMVRSEFSNSEFLECRPSVGRCRRSIGRCSADPN